MDIIYNDVERFLVLHNIPKNEINKQQLKNITSLEI